MPAGDVRLVLVEWSDPDSPISRGQDAAGAGARGEDEIGGEKVFFYGFVCPAPRATFSRLRLYAGQLDPTNPSRIRVPYELDGGRGTLELRLDNDGVLWLDVRDGPMVALQAGGEPAPAL